MPFTIKAEAAAHQAILPLRRLFLASLHAQVCYEACHDQGWADYCHLIFDDKPVGYAAVKGMEKLEHRDTIFEYYLLPGFRQHAAHFFRKLLEETNVQYVECQTNEPLLTALAHAFAKTLHEELWLLADDHVTHHHLPGALFRKRRATEHVPWQQESPGDYLLLMGEKIVAEGGLLMHYNPPYADVHMSVAPSFQGRGIGTYFVQELKKACYLSGHIPVARCQTDNSASRETLLKAGMKICGKTLWGPIRR